MTRYEPHHPSVAFGIAALILTACTLGVLVVLPTKMEPDHQAFAMLCTGDSATANPCALTTRKSMVLAGVRESAASTARKLSARTQSARSRAERI